MDEIILVGAGGHARACIDVIESTGRYKIAGLVEKDTLNNQINLGYAVIGDDSELQGLRQKYGHALITVGQTKAPDTRVRLFQLLNQLDYALPMIASLKAHVSQHAQIGDGTIVMHGAIVNANARIGKNCIINNQSLIEHDVLVGNHCHISTGTILNGESQVEHESFVGSGSVVRERIKIGPQSFVAGGTRVMRDLPSNSNYK